MAYQASHPVATFPGDPHETRHVVVGVVAVLLGVAVGVLALVAVWMGDSAHTAQRQAQAAADKVAAASSTNGMAGMAGMPGMASSATAGVETPSFAGAAPANADALAAAHRAFPAELPATTPGQVVAVNLGISHDVIQIAPGIRSCSAWFSVTWRRTPDARTTPGTRTPNSGRPPPGRSCPAELS